MTEYRRCTLCGQQRYYSDGREHICPGAPRKYYYSACGLLYIAEADKDRHEGQCNTCIDVIHRRNNETSNS